MSESKDGLLAPEFKADRADSDREQPLVFPEEVEAVIAEIFPSDDPLDAPDFNPVDYINELFPTEQSLNNLDDVLSEMRCKIQSIDEDMRRVVRGQTDVGEEAASSLEEAQAALVELFSQIRDIKSKAAESESMVRDITSDIKQLDTAKRNLTSAITTLNHLHMLVGGVSTLKRQTKERQYGGAALLLQGLLEVLSHFRGYLDIPQIKEMSDEVKTIQEELGAQITRDFKTALAPENAKGFTPGKQLAEACLVVSTLDPKVKQNLLKFLISGQLAEYTIMFGESEEIAWLDKIDNRFTWLKRHLIDFEERLGAMFPPDWEVSERIAVEFCKVTRKQLEKIMFRRRHEIDTKILLHAIQKTTNFESLLSRRFTGITLKQQVPEVVEGPQADSANPFEVDDESIDKSNPFYEEMKTSPQRKQAEKRDEQQLSPFHGMIIKCYEPYLHIYIESQDQNLTELVDRAAQEQRDRGYTNLAVEGSSVLHSCGDLFMFFKKCMVQCAQLSTAEPMLALQDVFRKHLREYATKILYANMPKSAAAAGQSTLASMTNLTKDLKDFSTQGLIQNFQNLLREGDTVKISPDERVFLCCVVVTSEYIIETTQQLEAKLKEKVDPDFVSRISLVGEQNVYHGVISSCIQLLVQELETSCEPPLASMVKMPWAGVESVGDQSPYVTAIANIVKQTIPVVRDNLASSRKYFTQFCIKFASSFIPKFLQNLYKCKPLSTVGAEQLLLDTHSVKTLLLDLPSLGSQVAARKAPASYTKIVIKGMTRAEMTLKVVMSPFDPAKPFVEQYIKLVTDAESADFQKVLDMKGMRKVDQTQYMDLFKTLCPDTSAAGMPSKKPGVSTGVPLMGVSSPMPSGGEESRIKKLERLIKQRL